jgi:NADPH:quinone reductase-like Zn-dependent oxidoreductase
MNAIVVKKHSLVGHGILEMAQEYPKPVLKPNSFSLMIKVDACALNPGDLHILQGRVSLVIKPKFPYIPGFDVSGVVEQVGTKCKR